MDGDLFQDLPPPSASLLPELKSSSGHSATTAGKEEPSAVPPPKPPVPALKSALKRSKSASEDAPKPEGVVLVAYLLLVDVIVRFVCVCVCVFILPFNSVHRSSILFRFFVWFSFYFHEFKDTYHWKICRFLIFEGVIGCL